MSYRIAGRLDNRRSFRNITDICHRAGIKVIIDTVFNHMSALSGISTDGSSYSKYNYPGLYSFFDFDDYTSGIRDYSDHWNAQHCKLLGLADLDTHEEYPRRAISGYINDLLSLGVDDCPNFLSRITSSRDLPCS
ncbi:glycoside hydrolase superfamily [Fusarium redolens]|uniref:Glycoside hydrolase superfamily n=1 Tax=Fusarium redolens TaxID=48865 RepID=A0A9P9HD93_FUSRE|nr:glycoside hydrolase superfamily [Fusarium redolens]KAH7255111.1 glycoside hydrolase superfamily [Fusarium redolens]